MSVITHQFYNVKCDRCGAILNDEWWVPDMCDFDEDYQEQDWKEINGKDYCPDCYYYDDDDEIKVKDNETD